MTRFTRLPAEDRRQMLIEAACACMADHGPAGFTVDRICARAGVSRGLITHHFGSMAGLMAETYARLYAEDTPPPGAEPDLDALLDHVFDPARFNRPRLNLWLSIWSAIANTSDLTDSHRSRYGVYACEVTACLIRAGAPQAQAPALALALIALIDGLSLHHCIDPAAMPARAARAAALAFVAPSLNKV